MKYLLIAALFLSSCTTTRYYIVRHAEKAPGTGDVSLSETGKQHAQALASKLNGKVQFLASTNFQRTKQTVEPLANVSGLGVNTYTHTDTAWLKGFLNRPINTLFVGHSNTVDDLVNYFMGEKVMTDLSDSAYGDLFIVVKKGKKVRLEKERF